MASLLPLPGMVLPPANTTHCATFAAFYKDATWDPCRGQCTAIMQRFDPEVNNVTLHIMLMEQDVGV
jgi:hypothetical protein